MNPNNFIANYDAGDSAIVFQVQVGSGAVRRDKVINVCKYLDSGILNSTIWVLLEGGTKIEYVFDNDIDATLAMSNFRSALDTLQVNCALSGGTPIPAPYTILDINLEGPVGSYVALMSNSSLVALQWYDVNDVNGTLGRGAGQVYRLLTMKTNDNKPQGILLSTNEKVIIDVTNLQLADVIEAQGSLISLNKSRITLQPTDSGSEYIYANNKSSVLSLDSTYIFADRSTLDVRTCTNIKAFNSNVVLFSSSNCIFEDLGITPTLNLIPYGEFSDIIMNQTGSIGKVGRGSIDMSSLSSITLYAYQTFTYQTLKNTLVANCVITLDNVCDKANAEFTLYVDPAAVFGTKKIDIKNRAGATLVTINDGYTGQELKFVFDKTTTQFVFLSSNQGKSFNKVFIVTNGATTFTLDNTPKFPELSELVINGQVQMYGASEDYTIADKTLTWNNKDFTLATTDKMFITYR